MLHSRRPSPSDAYASESSSPPGRELRRYPLPVEPVQPVPPPQCLLSPRLPTRRLSSASPCLSAVFAATWPSAAPPCRAASHNTPLLVNCACWPSFQQYIHTYMCTYMNVHTLVIHMYVVHGLGPNTSARASRSHYPLIPAQSGANASILWPPSVQYACAQRLLILPRTLHLRHPTPQPSQ
jgi:hypothetical protein